MNVALEQQLEYKSLEPAAKNDFAEIHPEFSPESYQKFVARFVSPHTSNHRFLVQYGTGTGKSITAIITAMEFIKFYKMMNIGSVYIITFGKKPYERDLMKYPEFGFVTQEEITKMADIERKFGSTDESLQQLQSQIRRRFTNRRARGFFKFFGYKEFFNYMFTKSSAQSLDADKIYANLTAQKLGINEELLQELSATNCLFVCDEIHDVYNIKEKNNWGVALQLIFDMFPRTRALLMSATPFTNSVRDSVNILNLLTPHSERIGSASPKKFVYDPHMFADFRKSMIDKNTYFDNYKIRADKLNALVQLFTGKVGYIRDVNLQDYPQKLFAGEVIPGIEYLQFTRTPMSAEQKSTLTVIAQTFTAATMSDDTSESALAEKYENPYNIFDFCMPVLPKSAPITGVASGQTAMFAESTIENALANADYTKYYQVTYNKQTGVISGPGLAAGAHLPKMSPKYNRMIADLLATLKPDAAHKGKIFIFHKFVKFIGVSLIEQVLIANGFVKYGTQYSASSVCWACGKEYGVHAKSADSHFFTPSTFITVHGAVDQKTVNVQMDIFNSDKNVDGKLIGIIIGSKKLKQSYELKAVRQLIILSIPDSVSQMLQIFGRCIRKKSHSLLAESERTVTIKIYTMSDTASAAAAMSYEELRYKRKMELYLDIQTLEKKIKERAVNAQLHFSINSAEFQNDPNFRTIDTIAYTPVAASSSRSTFTEAGYYALYKQEDVSEIQKLMLWCFYNKSPVWNHDELIEYIKNGNIRNRYLNMKYIPDDILEYALQSLLWQKNTISLSASVLSKSGIIITTVAPKTYIATTLDASTGAPIIDVTNLWAFKSAAANANAAAMSVAKIDTDRFISTYHYIHDAAKSMTYADRRAYLIKNYGACTFGRIIDIACKFDLAFHAEFLEEVISYVFRFWTGIVREKNANHKFYIMILYFYDMLGHVIWANTAKSFIAHKYQKYAITCPHTIDSVMYNKAKERCKDCKEDHTEADIIIPDFLANSLKKRLALSDCSWCPDGVQNIYAYNLKLSEHLDEKYPLEAGKTRRVSANILPTGHTIKNVVRFYDPDINAFADVENYMYTEDFNNKDATIENPIVIGFLQKKEDSIFIKFKLRAPRKASQQQIVLDDKRKMQSGVICYSKSKKELIDIAKKLGMLESNVTEATYPYSIQKICEDIKAKLIYLQLEEVRKGGKIRYFYFHWESKAE
jgi:hypothetical protein